jgi:hypothetical protein
MCPEGPLAEPGDGLENVIGGFGPSEGLRVLIVAGDEGGDGILQLCDAAMDPSFDLPLGEKGEPVASALRECTRRISA